MTADTMTAAEMNEAHTEWLREHMPADCRISSIGEIVTMLDAGAPVTIWNDYGRGKTERHKIERATSQRIGALTLTLLHEPNAPDWRSIFGGKSETVAVIEVAA